MKVFYHGSDGGKTSGVTGFWLIEIKSLFSVVLLRFSIGSREAFHTHAFNAITWWIKGEVVEHLIDGSNKVWRASFFPKYTPKTCFHKIFANKTTYALSFRGPWAATWREYRPVTQTFIKLTHGRKVVEYDIPM